MKGGKKKRHQIITRLFSLHPNAFNSASSPASSTTAAPYAPVDTTPFNKTPKSAVHAGFNFELMGTKRLAPCASGAKTGTVSLTSEIRGQRTKQRARRALGTDNDPCFRDAPRSAKCVGPCAQPERSRTRGNAASCSARSSSEYTKEGIQWRAFGFFLHFSQIHLSSSKAPLAI